MCITSLDVLNVQKVSRVSVGQKSTKNSLMLKVFPLSKIVPELQLCCKGPNCSKGSKETMSVQIVQNISKLVT